MGVSANARTKPPHPPRPPLNDRKGDFMLTPILRSLLAVLALALCSSALAQQYPNRPVRVVVPFGTGSPDTIARILGQQLATQTGQPFVVDNRAGANGMIGTDIVVKSPADGYTVLLVSTSIVVNPSIYKKMPFDPLKDLEPVTNVCSTEALILGVHPSVAANSARELVELVRRPGSAFSYGSPGIGNTLHLAGALFAARAGLKVEHVPYKGAGPAIAGLMAGDIQMMFMTAPLAIAQIKAGRIRAIGYTHKTRASFLPEVPTMEESGVAGMELDGGWFGLFAPAGTPPEIIARLSGETRKALALPSVHERMNALGLDPVGSLPAEFRAQVEAQHKAYAEMVRLAGVQPE
jgi:tripartite-type tricarboxylate transporter receptor subunit TctC